MVINNQLSNDIEWGFKSLKHTRGDQKVRRPSS